MVTGSQHNRPVAAVQRPAGTYTPHHFPPKQMVHGDGGACVGPLSPLSSLHSFICFPWLTSVVLLYSSIPLHPLLFPTLYLHFLRSYILLSSGSSCFPHFPPLSSASFFLLLFTHSPFSSRFFRVHFFPSLPLSSEVSPLFFSLPIRTWQWCCECAFF